jgi:hypothetical protein
MIPASVRDAIERSKPEIERHLAQQAALAEQRKLQQSAAQTQPRTPTVVVPPKKPLTTEDLIEIYTEGAAFEESDSHKPHEPRTTTTLFPVKLRLVSYLKQVWENGEYSANFNYPAHKADAVQALFKAKGVILDVAPLAEPGPDTKTAKGLCARRGGCGGTVMFPPPEDLSLLDDYPKARAEAARLLAGGPLSKQTRVVYSNYKLALQLKFDHGFPLVGKLYADSED